MVYLTINPTILEALEKLVAFESAESEKKDLRNGSLIEDGQGARCAEVELQASAGSEKASISSNPTDDSDLKKISTSTSKVGITDTPGHLDDPSLLDPKLGNPISHSQIIEVSRKLKKHDLSPRTLDALLRGSRVYVPPPKPKPEPTSEYKALMARLRREEEARSYERMINPPPPMETFAQRFPMSSAAHAFPSYQEPEPEDEVTHAEINRQMALIFNVLISIVACAGAIWVAAKWWSTPARLALSMSGSFLVGVAEVVVYGGYIRRVGEAKGKEKGVQEVKEVLRTWVVGGEVVDEKQGLSDIKVRRRKKDAID